MQNVAGEGSNLPTRESTRRLNSSAPVRSAFRRQHRLVKRDVVGLLKDGARLAKANLVIKLSENKFGGGRLAIAVPKRILKRAVDRNRVKRVIRETFRLNAARVLPVDLLVTLQSSPKATDGGGITAKPVRHQLRQTAKQLLADICQRFGRALQSHTLSNG
ncbi:MAG: ribonuclease P protein component [Betaproteobacteria bacterium]